MGKQNLCKHFFMIPSKLGKLEIALDSVQSGTQPGLFEECPVAQSRGVTYCTGQQKHWLQTEQFQVQDEVSPWLCLRRQVEEAFHSLLG